MFTVKYFEPNYSSILSSQSRITAMQQTRYSDKSLVIFVGLFVSHDNGCYGHPHTGHSGCSSVDEDATKWTRYEL